jgi:hypothetical protein
MADKPMLVVQDESGAQFAMTEESFKDGEFEDQGYSVVGYEDGTPYEGSLPKAKPPEPAQLPAEPEGDEEPKRGRRAKE